MEDFNPDIKAWGAKLASFHLPRWTELPELELYMDQVLTLVTVYLSPVIPPEKHNLLTKAMVNNYVKLGMIPAPKKKRYDKTHVAFLLAITILKQVLTIPEIKEGILFQAQVAGIQRAYDFFCEETELALKRNGDLAQGKIPPEEQEKIEFPFLAARAATLSFANKLLAEKVIECEIAYLQNKEKTHE
ncbi:DUF1836 domain-containing protein [Enterococcus sp. 2201sp1_2201st1_B8_2201SCRN_220225]|uniref:DUF1836 domain-containing protein n=1 Tax=unclassified Enterococcus TaxID=2608891 RepID=UPI0034A5403D